VPHLKVKHGSDWSWVSKYDLEQAGAHFPAAGGFGAPAAAAPAPAPAQAPAQAPAAAAEQTITLSKPVTARDSAGAYKRDIPIGSEITIYSGTSMSGRNNEIIIPEIKTKKNTYNNVPHLKVKHGSDWSWVSKYDLEQAGAHFPAGGGAPGPAGGTAGPRAPPARPNFSGERINFYSNKHADHTCNKYYELTNYWDRLDIVGGVRIDQEAHPTGLLVAGLPARLPAGGYLFYEGTVGWRSGEHRFQVHKCLPGSDRQRLYDISHDKGPARWSPGIGPDWASINIYNAGLERPDWNDVKMKVMYNTLLLKFRGNNHCRNVLERTRHPAGGRLLVEHAGTEDTFWGDGAAKSTPQDPWNVNDFQKDTWNGDKPDGSQRGYNWLGLLLMQIRDEIFEDDFCIRVFGVLPFNPHGHPRNGEGYFLDTDGSIL
jgi:ribA/ribD-fused uncharacterized protein